MKHELPRLPYAYDALEPHMDERTVTIHHDKHHQAYVDNLNKALEAYPELQEKSVTWLLQHLDEVPEAIRTAVRNNGGGHLDHTMYWKCMSPGAGAEPAGRLAEAIAASFGSFAAFKEQFSKTAATFFGSGWIWLCADSDGKLSVATTPGHDNPLYQGLDPLLVLDVWEHAYYLKYENRRAEFIAAWWNLVDWDYVAHNYLGAQFDAGLYKAAEWVGGTWAKLEAEWKKLTGA